MRPFPRVPLRGVLLASLALLSHPAPAALPTPLSLVLAQGGPTAEPDAPALFSRLGCALCHAPGARYHDRLTQSAARSEEEVTRWIRNPEKYSPGTPMPAYSSLVDEPSARALARWIRAGGPGK